MNKYNLIPIFKKITAHTGSLAIAIAVGVVSAVVWEYFAKPSYDEYHANKHGIEYLYNVASSDSNSSVKKAAIESLGYYDTQDAKQKLAKIAMLQPAYAAQIALILEKSKIVLFDSGQVGSEVSMPQNTSELNDYAKISRLVSAYQLLSASIRDIKKIAESNQITEEERKKIDSLGLMKDYDRAIDSINASLNALKTRQASYVGKLAATQDVLRHVPTYTPEDKVDIQNLEDKILRIREQIRPATNFDINEMDFGKRTEISRTSAQIEILGFGGRDQMVASIAQKIDMPSQFRIAAIKSMGLVGRGKYMPLLVQLLADPDPAIRMAAVRSIAQINSESSSKRYRSNDSRYPSD